MSSNLDKKIRRKAEMLKKKKEFPAFVSGAEYRFLKITAESGKIEKSAFVKSLKNRLKPFGPIGSKYKGSSIGFCAETISANRVLQKYPSKINSLIIGVAIRPKTLQIGKKCKICKSLF